MSSQSLRDRTFQILSRVRSSVRDILPREPIPFSPPYMFMFGMFSRSLRFFDGNVALLEKNLPEEALVLGRSLFIDALRLAELDESESKRTALILGWKNTSIAEQRGLIKEAIRLGLENDQTTLFTHINEEERKMQAYSKSHGVGRLQKFQSVPVAAKKFGREYDYWTYYLSHEIVHGSDVAFLYSRRKLAPDIMAMYTRTTDPAIICGVGCFAAMSLIQAGTAIGNMFARPNVEQLKLLKQEIKQFAEQGNVDE